MKKLDFGAKQTVETCMGIKAIEKVLIITDKETLEVGKALEKAVLEIIPKEKLKLVFLENYGERPLIKFPSDLMEKAKWCDVCFAAFTKKGNEKINEMFTIRGPLRDFCLNNKKRIAAMWGITKRVMEQGMNVDYNIVKELSTKVYGFVKNAKQIIVKTDAGTDLTIDIKNAMWMNTYGDYTKTPQQGTNLPSGEVYCCPRNVNGTLVANYELGAYFTRRYGPLKEDLIVEIKNSRVISIKSKDKKLENEFKQYIKRDENADRIGEVGIGTNIGIKEPIGVFLQDEKIPGIHLAVGKPCAGTFDQKKFPEGCWKSKVHCDLLMKNPTVTVDGKTLMEKGKFII